MRQTQTKFFNDKKLIGVGPESNDLSFPSYEKLAYAFGYPYYKATTNKELKETYDAFMNEESYAILEILVSKEQFFEPKNDAKQLEANALLAGFSDVKINDTTYVDYKTQRKMDTLSVSFVKPRRRNFEGENVEVNVSSTSEVNTSSKKRTNSSRKK